MRRMVWGSVAILALAALAVVSFLATHERVSEQEIVWPAAEARADRFLAATRLLRRLGIPVQRQRGFERALRDPGRRVYLLAAPRGFLSQDALASLVQAVEQGAHLIVESEALEDADPVFDAFGIQRDALPEREDESEIDDWSDFSNRRDPLPADSPGLVEVEWVAGTPLRVGMRGGEDLSIERPVEWQMVGDLGEVRALHFRRGLGRVTAVNDMSFATNWGLGRNDEAEFLWQLLHLGDGPPEALVILEAAVPGLLAWLIEHAWRALLALVVLLVLAIWSAMPRRGRLRADPERARRRLGEHLAASGRLVHAGGGDVVLAAALRTEALDGLRRRHPELAALPAGEQLHFAVERLKLPRRHAQALFEPVGPSDLLLLARAARGLRLALEPRRAATNPLYHSGSESS